MACVILANWDSRFPRITPWQNFKSNIFDYVRPIPSQSPSQPYEFQVAVLVLVDLGHDGLDLRGGVILAPSPSLPPCCGEHPDAEVELEVCIQFSWTTNLFLFIELLQSSCRFVVACVIDNETRNPKPWRAQILGVAEWVEQPSEDFPTPFHFMVGVGKSWSAEHTLNPKP